MNNFSELVTSSVLLRTLAILIVGLTVVAAIIVGMVEMLQGLPINPIIWTIVGTGVVQALAVLNINYGVVLQPATKPNGTATTTTTTTGGTNVTNP